MSCVHEEYEMLCVFTAIGQLSEWEADDLRRHADSCRSCHQRLLEIDKASFAYFRYYAGEAHRVSTPAGMERRFAERAAILGVPLRESSSLLSPARLLGAALAILFLAVFAQTGWKVLRPRMPEGAAMHLQATGIAPSQIAPEVTRREIRHPLVKKAYYGKSARQRGSTTRLHDTDSYDAPRRETRQGETYSMSHHLWPSSRHGAEASASRPHVTISEIIPQNAVSSIRLPVTRTFEMVSVPRFWTHGEDTIPGKHAFRYNATFASLSFLGLPKRAEALRFPAMNEPPPLFRIDSPKTW